jgi:hypothetical protein
MVDHDKEAKLDVSPETAAADLGVDLAFFSQNSGKSSRFQGMLIG